jgi:hypothetical protein
MQTLNISKFARHFATLQRQLASTTIDPIHAENTRDAIDKLCELLPHGSGIDSGIKFDSKNSKPDRLIFTFGFHHMNENGYYDGWTDHALIITPCLQDGYNLRITGRNRNDIKDYLYGLFYDLFTFDASEPLHKPQETNV